TRATTHSRHTRPNGVPFRGLKPVQVALAVSRKATAMVAIKPHNISCACQAMPINGALSHCGAKIHMAMEIKAQAPPAIDSGLNPRLRKACILGRGLALADTAACRVSAMVDLCEGLAWLVVQLIAIPEA